VRRTAPAAVLRENPRQGVAEGEEDREVGMTLLESRHDLAALSACARAAYSSQTSCSVLLPSVFEDLAFVLLTVEQDTARTDGSR